MMLNEVLLGVLIIVNLVGGYLLKRWIDSLRGTVEAQKTALDTVQRVVDAAMTVFKASDPDRWAKEVTIHKDLADKKAAATIEDERRKAEERIQQVDGRARVFVDQLARLHGEALGAATRLLAEIPRGSREPLISGMQLNDSIRASLLKAAAELPDPVPALPSGFGLGELYRQTFALGLRLPTPDPKRGGMNVTPPKV